jgi:hypothetical protein
LLSEINRFGAQTEAEAKLLQEALVETEKPPEGVDMPKGMGPTPSASPSPVSPRKEVSPKGANPSIRRPPINPDRSIRIDRRPR